MGKLTPRLSSRKKAKRWRKGQSSNSNPETKKYRNQVRSFFFQPNLESKNLTVDALKKHNVLQGTEPMVESDGTESAIGASTFKTFDTFASDFSNCSNVSFSRFLNYFQIDSVLHKEMLAVLSAITEVIKQNGGTESATEYYAALMTTLVAAETEESISAILALLGIGLKTVPKNILRQQFGQASQTFLQILTKYATEENFFILQQCIRCLTILLKIQESAAWNNSSIMQIVDVILAFIIHSKPKVRKIAQYAIRSLLKDSDIMTNDNPPSFHPATSQIAKYCFVQLEMANKPGQITVILQTLNLLKDIVHQFPKSFVKSLCEKLFSIMTLNNILLSSCCLQTLHGLFISKPPEVVLSPQLNAQIINALYDYQPAPGDTQSTLAWLAVMQEAHCNLAVHSLELWAANIPKIIEKSTELWLSDKTEIIAGASHTIKALLEICVAPFCENTELAEQHKPTLIKIIQFIQEGMKYQYNAAWHHVLHLFALIFKIIGPICESELVQILIRLAELRDSYKFTYNLEIEYAVGAAVKSLGPNVVLSAIPLQNSECAINLKRSWLLPILKDCINGAPLFYFINNLMPLAELCREKSMILKQSNDGIGAHSNELLSSQIWALLPSFCNNPPDIKENFQKIARTLGMILSERKDLRLFVMSSLRKLIKISIENNNENDIKMLARFSKNYLPILFNLYAIKPCGSDEEGQRLSCFETIKIYLKITNKELIGELFDKALENLCKADETDFFKESIFDLVRVLCQYTDSNRIQILYEKCIPLLKDKKHQKEQKKAYRFLEEICGSTSEVCQNFVSDNRKEIQKAITNSLETLQKSSKGARIRCITHLVEKHPQLEKTKFLKAIVPEAVICVKELNEKCRTSSYTLLNTIAAKFENNLEHFNEYLNMIIAGVHGNPMYCSATLLVLTSICHYYYDKVGVDTLQNILELSCNLITEANREITLSALSFIKEYISINIPLSTKAQMLQKIIQSLISMTDDCKRHFRLKVRDILVKLIRKFGSAVIINMIPSSDPVMHKRIKNICKIEDSKKKLKEQKKIKNCDDSDEEFSVHRKPKSLEAILADSDDELNDSDDEKCVKLEKQKSREKTWIREPTDKIINFIDPSTAKNITATKPVNSNNSNAKKLRDEHYDFKTASDGRFIITDDNDSEEKKRNRKRSMSSNDSENDEEDKSLEVNTPTGIQGKQKRKRKISNSLEDHVSDTRSLLSKYQAGGSGIHRLVKNDIKTKKEIGEEYRSKKGFGDVKRKGKPDPYAYIPLKKSALNQRNKAKEYIALKKILLHSKKNKKLSKNMRNKKI